MRHALHKIPWPLLPILAAQAFLSARLLHANTAFVDEATYLYAGHQEWNHWIHGWSVPAYATYFSGAPTIYPPLGALADSVGGLAGARLLSLLFMLLATGMLWATASRLYGRAAAFTSCALFVSLGSTQALGCFATYDAMAFSLLTAATYCLIRAAQRPDSTRWWVAGASLLALANATKYATALWDPAAIGLASILVYERVSRRAASRRAAATVALVVTLVALGLYAGGPYYIDGITSTTITRGAGTAAPGTVLKDAWHWIGWVVVFAGVGVAVAVTLVRNYTHTAINAVLVAAAVFAPLNQARIHTTTSLQKHVDFGAWYGCIAAGYVTAILARWFFSRYGRAALALMITLVGLLASAPAGYAQSGAYFHDWPDRVPLAHKLAPFVKPGNDQYLAEEYDVAAYYLGSRVHSNQWDDTWFFRYKRPDGSSVTGIPAYQQAVQSHYFSLIILDFGDTLPVDNAILRTIDSCVAHCGYRVVATAPYHGAGWSQQFTVWQYEGGTS